MKRFKSVALLLLLLVMAAPSAMAQLEISVDSVLTDEFPTVKVNVVTRMSGVITRGFDSTNFRIIEDGFEQAPLSYTCPQPTQPFSLTIIIAVGSSMSAGDVSYAKGVARNVIDRMNGIIDEASVYTYSDISFLQQEFTHIKPLLAQRIDAIAPTSGGNHIWDGIYGGVSYCANDGVHTSRGVLVLSNARGDGGSKSLSDVISLAKLAKLPVHCLPINAVGIDQDLRELAAQSGGRVFNNADQAAQELIDLLNGTPPYCTLSYVTNNECRDGEDRMLNVRLRKDNDSTDTDHTFALAADANTNAAITLKVDTATVTTGLSQDVALLLTPAVQNQRLYDGSLDVLFDTSAMKLQAVRTNGYMAEGSNAAVTPTASGATITLTGTARLDGSGTLMMLEFIGNNVSAPTVVQVSLAGLDPATMRGCLDVTFSTANITVIPKRASVTTAAQPLVFTWDSGLKHYTPDPGTVEVEVTNNGDLPVSQLTATLEEATEFRMAYGDSRTVPVVPASLDPGKKGVATFYIQPFPRDVVTSAKVNAVVNSAEGASATQRLFINIPAADAAYRMDCQADQITISGGKYTPDPAEVRATITSAGTMDSPAGEVTIELPAELSLSGGSATQQFAAMPSGNTQTLTWPIVYPTPTVKTDHDIMLISSSAGYPNDTCHATLTVPVLTAAMLEARAWTVPAQLDSTNAADGIQVLFRITNTGNDTARDVSSALMLTPEFVLNAGDTVLKQMGDIAPGDSADAVYVVKRINRSLGCAIDTTSICATISMDGAPVMTSVCAKLLLVPGVNLLPEITAVIPAVLDSIDKDVETTFEVQMFDYERGDLTYVWYVNGTEESRAGSQFAWTFNTLGNADVKVEIYDPCTIGTNDAVIHIWNFVVRDPTGIADNPAALREFSIIGNYPNPFNPGTVIEYRIPDGRHDVLLEVVDAGGRIVRTLQQGELAGGIHRVSFDASGLPSGTYLARLTAGGVVRVHGMVLVK